MEGKLRRAQPLYYQMDMAAHGHGRPSLTAGTTKPKLRAVMPLVWELVRPRRGLLALGFLLMVINRVAALVLPYSSRFLLDDVVGKHHVSLLKPLVLGVLTATLIQGITSFSLTQLLSKAAQRRSCSRWARRPSS